MLKRIGAEESGEFKAVASGTLPCGRPVVVNADGTVSVVANIAPTAATPTAITDTAANHAAICYDPDNQKVVIAWYDAGNSDYGTAVVGTVNPSNNTISFGSEVVFESADVDSIGMVYDTANDKVVIAYRDVGNSSYGTAIVGTVSGTSISFGTAVVFESGNSPRITTEGMCFDSTNGKVVIVYMDLAAGQKPTAIVGTVSGTGISFGTAHNFQNNTPKGLAATYDDVNEKVVIAMGRSEGGITRTTVRTGTISGTGITVQGVDDATKLFDGQAADTDLVIEHIGGGKHIVGYSNYTDSEKGFVDCISLSGNTFTVTADDDPGTLFDEGDVVNMSSTFVASKGQVIITYSDEDSDNSHKGKYVVVTNPSGLTVQVTDPVEFESGYTELPAVVYDTNAERAVVAYQDQGNSSFLTANILTPGGANLTSENYIGMSRGTAFQTGSAASAGSAQTFQTTANVYTDLVYDSNAEKIVIAYEDNDDSRRGRARVGTITGTDISYGTEATFSTNSTNDIGIGFDSNSNKVLIVYTDVGNSSYGTAIVGTVSGTDISFGSPTVFHSASTIGETRVVFDSSSNKFAVIYLDQADSNKGRAIVGTISGTSVSFGSEATFSDTTVGSEFGATFDSNSNKVVIAYRDSGGSTHGECIVGTISGTDITFGSLTAFNSASTGYPNISFDATTNKCLVVYRDLGNSNYGTAIVGTVSGTSISFGSAAVFNAASTEYLSPASGNGNNTIAYKDSGDSNKLKLQTAVISGTSVSFGSDIFTLDDAVVYSKNAAAGTKFVVATRASSSPHGIAYVFQTDTRVTTRAEVANSGNASIDIIGSVSDNQIGLTAGQQYFVQNDGTIGTTADSPSVFAGTAISSTELLVKT